MSADVIGLIVAVVLSGFFITLAVRVVADLVWP